MSVGAPVHSDTSSTRTKRKQRPGVHDVGTPLVSGVSTRSVDGRSSTLEAFDLRHGLRPEHACKPGVTTKAYTRCAPGFLMPTRRRRGYVDLPEKGTRVPSPDRAEVHKDAHWPVSRPRWYTAAAAPAFGPLTQHLLRGLSFRIQGWEVVRARGTTLYCAFVLPRSLPPSIEVDVDSPDARIPPASERRSQ